MNSYKKSLKILAIGNSFSIDTLFYLPSILKEMGVEELFIGNLYIGGCSINKHLENFTKNAPAYTYYTSCGGEWTETADVSISDTLRMQSWDFVSIQHGTGDGSYYTLASSYENLRALITCIKEIIPKETKILFNMAWAPEEYHNHRDLLLYGGDQIKVYKAIAERTKETVLTTEGINFVCPTGTAIQNLRTTPLRDKVSRDGFHLSYEIGRITASLTFAQRVTGLDITNVKLTSDVAEEELKLAIKSALAAVKNPFEITQI